MQVLKKIGSWAPSQLVRAIEKAPMVFILTSLVVLATRSTNSGRQAVTIYRLQKFPVSAPRFKSHFLMLCLALLSCRPSK